MTTGHADTPLFTLRGEVRDADSDALIASRIYLNDAVGKHYFLESADPEGVALPYDRQNWANKNAVERYTNLSAHPFEINLPPGDYTLTVERGKEYRPLNREFTITDADLHLALSLERWEDMAAQGWYSGDTHVHREVDELRTILPAEDLHAAFPLTYWVTVSDTPPSQGEGNLPDPGHEPILVEPNRVIYPRNTEYELFRVSGVDRVLGAFFILNHQEVLEHTAPPVAEIGEQARAEGALIDMDKADWAWSMMLPPVLGVDLFELANNHIWRTEFAFSNWVTPAPAYMNLPNDGLGGTEVDWMHYGFHCYYALLNAGFRLRPTAGTANGVHPVPLGFGRVYVQVDAEFSPEAWFAGLDAGRSFVTTGPMIQATLAGAAPGGAEQASEIPIQRSISGIITSERPLSHIEVVINGRVAKTISPENHQNARQAYTTSFQQDIVFEESGWVALRCFEPHPGDKVRFAHTAPWHIDIEDRPLYPTPEQIAFLIERSETPRRQFEDLLSAEALAEFDQAAARYRAIQAEAEAYRALRTQGAE